MPKMTFFSSINGEFVSSGPPIEHLLQDRGLAYGHGLFETMALYQTQVPLLQQHLQRLVTDARKLGIDLSFETVETCVNAFIAALTAEDVENSVVKVILTAGVGGRGYQTPAELQPHIICISSPLPTDLEHRRRSGTNLLCCRYQLPLNSQLAGIKHLNRLDQILARNECDSAGYEDGVMFATDGSLIETTSANIFLKTASGWVTPSLDSAGVNGVMRTLLLQEIFPATELPVCTRPIAADELWGCNESFICNAIRGIVPVLSITDSRGENKLNLAIGVETKQLQFRLDNDYAGFK